MVLKRLAGGLARCAGILSPTAKRGMPCADAACRPASVVAFSTSSLGMLLQHRDAGNLWFMSKLAFC